MNQPVGPAAARAAKDVLRAQYRHDARINGIGIAGHRDRYTVRVNVVDASAADDLPDEVNGVPVEKVVVGRIRAMSDRPRPRSAPGELKS